MLCDGVPLQSAYKALQGVWWEVDGGKKNKKKCLQLPTLLKLAFGIDVIIDHVEIHPPSFCKPCKLSMERVLNASRQKKLVPFRSLVVPYKWKAHTADKCEVSEEQIIAEFNCMITFRFASILRCW